MIKKIIFLLLITPFCGYSQYSGTGSVSQGLATTTQTNLYSCQGGRTTNVGVIVATNGSSWTVPASTNFTNTAFPFSSNLYNSCDGNMYANAAAAIAALNGSDIVTVDADGEVITAYIFADNYFEMYINGVEVGKDKVPYTQFNSSIVRFKVKRPFTIAMHLVDWEENLGLGSELNGGSAYHCGDGGMVALFKDASNNIIAKTDNSWKAQTFYTSPIADLTCPTENGTLRLSSNCSTADVSNGSNFYALHWEKPANCFDYNFDDSSWPNASVYTNATVGVNNKPAYTNFTDIFDNVTNDADFIWSTNLILDNEVVVRYTVPSTTGMIQDGYSHDLFSIFPNPTSDEIHLSLNLQFEKNNFKEVIIVNMLGEKVLECKNDFDKISLLNFDKGVYMVKVKYDNKFYSQKLIVK